MQLSARDFPSPPRAVAHVELPKPYLPNNRNFQRSVADRLRRVRLKRDGSPHAEPQPSNIAEEVATHAVAECPDIGTHLRALRNAEDLERRMEALRRTIRGRAESLARQFDRVLRILEAWGYVEGWSLTEAGEMLAGLYHEADLLVAEALRAGLFDGLPPPAVAALASTLTFESRGPGESPEPWFPDGRLRSRWGDLEHLGHELNVTEEEAGLPLTRTPDPGFVAAAYKWSSGEDLEEVMAEQEITGGDFVRNVKQLIDLLRQMADAPVEPTTRKTCQDAAERLFRGVVSASSAVGSGR